MSILAIDQGTSATKAVVWSEQGIAAEIDVPVLGLTHHGDAIEQDPEALWQSIVAAGQQAADAVGTPIRAVAIGNQGETVLAWDRTTGAAVGPALSWQDRRSARVTADIDAADADYLHRATGLPVDPYFAAPKMAWLHRSLDLPPGGDVVVTTIDAWVNYRLAGRLRDRPVDGVAHAAPRRREPAVVRARSRDLRPAPGSLPRARALRRDARDHDRSSVRRCPSPG